MMTAAMRIWALAAAVTVAGFMTGCGDKGDEEKVPAATRVMLPKEDVAYTEPATEDADPDSLYYELSTDEPKDFATPEGTGYKIRKNGLAFKETEAGHGLPVEVGQTVDVKYSLFHLDKKLIESNTIEEKTKAKMFVFGQKVGTLPFWHEAIIGMKKGDKRRVIVPPNLAYGAKGLTGRIAPDETIILEVELKDIRGDSRAQIKAATNLVKGDPKTHAVVPDVDHLVIEDLKVGTGDTAMPGKKVSVHYTGWLAKTGEKFDSSRDKNHPFDFRIGAGQVIKGWDQGVEGMKVGGKRKLTIPPRLAYGPEGRPPTIPANATLVFEVELLDVQ